MCTRVVYSGSNGMVATGRSMDWKTDMHSNLWVFPRGMKRNGETGENSLEWTSRYGSVVTSAFEIASTDGMNEKGLVANLLWLPETEYPVRDKNKPGLAITAWVQYMLDNFATVEEAVAYIDEDTFQVVSDMMPDGSRQCIQCCTQCFCSLRDIHSRKSRDFHYAMENRFGEQEPEILFRIKSDSEYLLGKSERFRFIGRGSGVQTVYCQWRDVSWKYSQEF